MLKDYILQQFNKKEQINGILDCYNIDKNRYIIFWNEKIKDSDISNILEFIEKESLNNYFSKKKSIIIVGETNDVFKLDDLVYFNGIDTFVVFYLIDFDNKRKYSVGSGVFMLGLSCKKYVKLIDEIVDKYMI